MTISINFLRQRRKQLTALQLTDKKYAMILSYVSVGVVIAMVALFIVKFLYSSQVESLKLKQIAEQNKITTLASVEAEYLILAQKAADITTLLKGLGLRQEALQFFTTVFAQQQVTLSEVAFLDDGVIQFQVASKDIFQFNSLLTQLQSQELRAKYPKLTVTDLTRTQTANYFGTVSVQLPVTTPVPVAAKKQRVILDDNGKPITK